MRSITKRRRLAVLAAGLAGLMAIAAVACTGSANGGGGPTATTAAGDATSTVGPAPTTTAPAGEGQAIISVRRHDSLGDTLVNTDGMTLYIFTRDEPGVSNCSGGCAATWPPVTTVGEPMFEIISAQLGTITRDDGSTQVTVNGLPVYTYIGDTARGDANGQGLGDQWYVLDGAGNRVEAAGGPDGEDGALAATIQSFTLPNLQIETGTRVIWTNQDSAPHTVTAGAPGSVSDAFGSSSLSGDRTFSHTFDEPGRFDYFCQIHPDMTGVIVVNAVAEPTATATQTATSAPATSTPSPTATQEAATATATATPDSGAEQYSAVIQSFTHEVFTISAGMTVTWTNLDNAGHTVSAGTPEDPTTTFRSPVFTRNQTYTFTFDEPGEYTYFCEPHPFMRGRVIVE